ncbi:MAG: ribose 5-phosphate isomerase B [Flavobacteriales bacterium CG_4_10_14_0_2_um_filter_32_8]|nr:MAG: ribose 5-phosphate isomerase B [Bacteroidetes bacterium CG2_30_32_10]PJA09749.1 MAG: ribose 5-phosphate isomerase B [Flavobacteriales bacterium CG_4_10_14_0_2_um_filter_32_8]PJB14423.1 MAG: ribose 5-phosphate isomerase B [Flavobacteriales bacterium CG_4_9_14_3_um_filter_32_8]
MKVKKIAIGSDHAGFELKEIIIKHLVKLNILVEDFGTFSSERADYPDFAHPVANAVENNKVDLGILICGSGNGINMTANKHLRIRSALCWKPAIAEMARLHNDANIIALPARFISNTDALKCVDIFITTDFEGGRHTERINKIAF